MGKMGVGEWLKDRFSEIKAPLSAGRIEICGNFEATVHGCKRIIHYSPERITLAMKEKGRTLTLEGRELVCVSFFVGAVVIEGIIERVELSEHGKGEK